MLLCIWHFTGAQLLDSPTFPHISARHYRPGLPASAATSWNRMAEFCACHHVEFLHFGLCVQPPRLGLWDVKKAVGSGTNFLEIENRMTLYHRLGCSSGWAIWMDSSPRPPNTCSARQVLRLLLQPRNAAGTVEWGVWSWSYAGNASSFNPMRTQLESHRKGL